jgi:indole-3-glycerol phosphate synthase
MDRIEASREEAARLRGQAVSEVTPSRRSFWQYVAGSRDAPAVIARLSIRSTGASRDRLLAHARACDAVEVAALSMSLLDDLTPADASAAAAAVTAPLLREDPLVSGAQLYHSRLHGIDAVVLPAAPLGGELADLVDIAVSMHMSVVVECANRETIAAALRWPYAIIGVCSLAAARELGGFAPATRTIVLLDEVTSADEYAAARGCCDAVIVGPAALGSDVAAGLSKLAGD